MMNAQKSGGGPSGRKPTALARPEPLPEIETTFAHSSTKTPKSIASRSSRASKPLRTTLIVALGLAAIAACIWGAGYLADHLPNIILGLCIVLLGILFGALLAVRA